MSFLQLENKNFLITGVANKKSVAYHVAKTLQKEGANLFFSVQNEKGQQQVEKHFPNQNYFLCDVEKQADITRMANDLRDRQIRLDGLLHSIAFAKFTLSEGRPLPFHETPVEDFLQATNISCYSLVTLCNALKALFTPEASVVTVSISNTLATSYGYLGPIKAALDATVAYMAKSFSSFSKIRFNAVCSGPLKTSASAGIPNYIENFVYAEQLTMRKQALKTTEVANSIVFLLSQSSSGINASNMLIDAGMQANYFDQDLVKTLGKELLD